MKVETLPSGQRILYSDKGKTLANKLGEIQGPVIWLGKNANLDDFTQVDEPIEVEQD